jgi:hypothetical protein
VLAVTLLYTFAIAAAVVILLWVGWEVRCLGLHDWDTRRGSFTDTCRRCGAKRFK